MTCWPRSTPGLRKDSTPPISRTPGLYWRHWRHANTPVAYASGPGRSASPRRPGVLVISLTYREVLPPAGRYIHDYIYTTSYGGNSAMKYLLLWVLLLIGLWFGSGLAGELREFELHDGTILTGELLSLRDGVYTLKSP